MGKLVKSIAREMKNPGLLEIDDVFTVEETDSDLKRDFTAVVGKYLARCCLRARAHKARSIGWMMIRYLCYPASCS